MKLIGSKIDEVRIDGCLERFRSDLDHMRDIGLDAVELPVHGLDIILNGSLNVRRMEAVQAVLRDYQFLYSIHAPNPLNLMDRDNPRLHAEVLTATMEAARRIGAKAVVCHGGRFIPEEEFSVFGRRSLSGKEKARLLDQEQRLLQAAADEYPDVTVVIENARPYLSQSPYTYAETIDGLREQVCAVDRENVRINLDFGHLYMASEFYGFPIPEAVESIRDLVAHTHIHDNFGRAVHHYEKQQTHQLPFGRGDAHMPVGWGTLPVKAILDILRPVYSGLLMMELRSRYFDYIAESRQNLLSLTDPAPYF